MGQGIGTTVVGLSSTFVAQPSPTPPSDPGVMAWYSSALTDVHVDPSPASRYPLFGGQEPEAWYADGKWRMIWSTLSDGMKYTECSGDPTVAANWSSPVLVTIGAGHGYVYREAGVVYFYYCNAAQAVCVRTAAESSPAGPWSAESVIFTPAMPPGQSSLISGNICVVKDLDGTYRMFLEMMAKEALGSESTASTWQTWVSTAAVSPTTFTDPVTHGVEITSLRPLPASTVSGLEVLRENGQWVCYYHSSITGRAYPTQGYRAVNDSLAADTWTILDRKHPFVRRASTYDVDQVADLNPAYDSNGVGYLFYTGARNYSPSNWTIQVTRLLPTLMERSARGAWVPGQSRDNGALPEINAYTPWVQSSIPWLSPAGQAAVGTWGLDSSVAGMHGGLRRTNASPALNQEIAFDVVLAPGTYTFSWLHTTGPDHADVVMELGFYNTASYRQIGFYSCYSAGATPNVTSTTTFTVVGGEAGRARIKLRAYQKNASSSSYVVGDQGWSLTRTDA